MRISDWSSDVCSSDLFDIWARPSRFFVISLQDTERAARLEIYFKELARFDEVTTSFLYQLFLEDVNLSNSTPLIRGASRSEERSVGKGCVRSGKVGGEPFI